MARSFWKGKYLLSSLLQPAYKTDFSNHLNWNFNNAASPITSIDNELLLYRRNQVISSSMVPILNKINYKLYNGYNFYKKHVTSEYRGLNIGNLILTREHKVTHKIKVTKAQRRVQQSVKKKTTLSSKTKIKKKTTSIKKKK